MYTAARASWSSLTEPESRIELSRRPLGLQLLEVGAIYAASRVFSTILLGLGTLIFVAHGWQMPWLTDTPVFAEFNGHWFPQLPNLFDISSMWDSAHYADIAQYGYPTVLPRSPGGYVEPNSWAFLPLYPMFVSVVQWVFRTGFSSTGVVVSLVFGAAATLMLYLVVRDRVGQRAARFAAVVFAFGPLAYVLQLAYAESLFLFLFFAALYFLQRRRYVWMMAPAVLASFTRPGGIALALAFAVVFVVRVRDERRARGQAGAAGAAFPRAERIKLVVATLVAGLAGIAWPIIAWATTGVENAYTATELSWRDGFLGHTSFKPFTAWVDLAWRYLGPGGILLMVLIVVLFAVWIGRRGIRPLGVENLAAAGSYALYLLAVFMPQQSIFRVAMPLAPLMGDPGIVGRPRLRRTVLWVAILAQPLCIALLWFYANP